MAIFNGTHRAETINGTAADDRIFGDNGNDVIDGGAGDDWIDGGNGADIITGGAGNDSIDGGNGLDVFVLAGNRADYHLTQRGDGSVAVRDLRAGSPDGTDRLVNIERVQFADGKFKIVDLISANAAPVALDDQLTFAEDAGPVNVTATLLANDSDPDGGPVRVSAVQTASAQGAVVTLAPDGGVTYDAGNLFDWLIAGQTATDTFTYTIADEGGVTSTATATVTITGKSAPPPPPPVEYDAFFFVMEDATSEDMFGTLVESFGFEIVAVETPGTIGTVTFDLPAGILNFTADDPSTDMLNGDAKQETWFTIVGDEGERKTIGIYIDGVNDPIDAIDDSVSLAEGQTSSNLWYTLIGNDVDPDNGVNGRFINALETTGTQGTVTFDPSKSMLTYSAAGIDLEPGQTLVDTFTYTVKDGSGVGGDTATVTVTVTGGAGATFSTASAPSGTVSMSAFAPEGAAAPAPVSGFEAMQAPLIIGAEHAMIA